MILINKFNRKQSFMFHLFVNLIILWQLRKKGRQKGWDAEGKRIQKPLQMLK